MNRKQRAFVREYLIDFNATRAAISAGYSARSAREIGRELLRREDVTLAVAKAAAVAEQRAAMTVAEVLQRLKVIAEANVSDFLTFGPRGVRLRPMAQIDPEKLHAIAEVRETEHGIAFKLHNKIGALQLLAKHLGMLVDRHEHKIEGAEVRFYLPDNGRRPAAAASAPKPQPNGN